MIQDIIGFLMVTGFMLLLTIFSTVITVLFLFGFDRYTRYVVGGVYDHIKND